MGDLFQDKAVANSADAGQQRPLDLLKIACCVAWCDGDVSPEEKQLLEDLVFRYFPLDVGDSSLEDAASQLSAWALDLSALDEVIPRLSNDEDKLLAAKFAYMVARVGQKPGDEAPINPQEKKAYRYLVAALGLEEHQLEAVEWAADQELESTKGIKGLFGFLFDGLSTWPSQDVLGSSPMLWL
jgi:tellurite resistance protein